ncbi:phosphatase PAP2 family protein [Streptomyces canarius]|uniref:phosphatase PAP2 family protein n=1 Tax=Streptomyces canarius TaxID=285453 RepID=UPI001676C1C3|nr:phosphatase PAP2 family protein [Streptomyces canarius]
MRGRLEAAAAGAALLLAGVYGAFVRTATGQRWENAVLAGRREDETLAAARAANGVLDHITLSSLGAAVAVLLLIGLARRRSALTVAAVGTVGVSLLLAEVLKRYVLPRPDLVNAPERRLLGNSFPSGHTTIAMSVLFGLTLVVPYRWRGVAVGVCALWATFVGAYTVAAGWHRPSDTIGADLLVLAVACALTALLARSGRVRPVADRPRPLRALFVIAPLCGVALAGLGCGTVLLVDSMFRLPPGDPAVPRLAYAGGHVLAAGASAAVTLVLLALLHRVDLDRPREPATHESPHKRGL